MRAGAAILVRIVRKCALRATTKRLMHPGRIDRALTGAPQAPAAYGVSRPAFNAVSAGRRSTAPSPLNAVSAGLFGHRPADRCGHLRRGPEAEPSQGGSIANSIEARAGAARSRRSRLAGN